MSTNSAVTKDPAPAKVGCWISRLNITNFRNYAQATLQFDDARPVVLVGQNGAGKTNILEAVSLLMPGKGLRGAKLPELDCQLPSSVSNPFRGQPWSLFSEIITEHEQYSVAVGRDPNQGEKKLYKLDGENVRSQEELRRIVSVISLTPQMDNVFLEGAASRRGYLDHITGIFQPLHSRHLHAYEHAKSERRKVLFGARPDPLWLGGLEHKMAENAVAIAAARLEVLAHLAEFVTHQTSDDELFPKAILGVEGFVEHDVQTGMSALDAETSFAQALANSRTQDRESKRTHIGPHRSDFRVIHPVKELPAELCSTGEQKALLLSITMASIRAKLAWDGKSPLVLLDDIMSHFDEQKRTRLQAELMGLNVQLWLSGTDKAHFAEISDKSWLLNVDNGVIIR